MLVLLLIGSVTLAAYSFYRLYRQFGAPRSMHVFKQQLWLGMDSALLKMGAVDQSERGAARRLCRALEDRVHDRLDQAQAERSLQVSLASEGSTSPALPQANGEKSAASNSPDASAKARSVKKRKGARAAARAKARS